MTFLKLQSADHHSMIVSIRSLSFLERHWSADYHWLFHWLNWNVHQLSSYRRIRLTLGISSKCINDSVFICWFFFLLLFLALSLCYERAVACYSASAFMTRNHASHTHTHKYVCNINYIIYTEIISDESSLEFITANLIFKNGFHLLGISMLI